MNIELEIRVLQQINREILDRLARLEALSSPDEKDSLSLLPCGCDPTVFVCKECRPELFEDVKPDPIRINSSGG